MGRMINALLQYNKMVEIILDKDRHLTSQPTQPPSVANEHHHSQQQDLAVYTSRKSHTVNDVQNITVR
jgi:flagellar basal body L-ring protein FlgH